MISVVFESYIVEGNRARKDRAALIMYNLIWSKARFKNILKILFFLLTDFGNAYRVINNGHRGGDRHFRKIATNYLLKLTLITQAGVINAKNSLYKTYIYFNQKLLEIFKEFSNFDFGELLIHKSRLFLTIIERDFPMNDAIQKYTSAVSLDNFIDIKRQNCQCSEQNSSGIKNYFSEIWATDFKQINNLNNVININGGISEF